MILKNLSDLKDTPLVVDGKYWRSHRLLVAADRMGFSLHETWVFPGGKTHIHYKNHLEAVYCIEGRGCVELIESGRTLEINPGTLYALDLHDEHWLWAEEPMRLVCVFTPALRGDEVHGADGSYPSGIGG